MSRVKDNAHKELLDMTALAPAILAAMPGPLVVIDADNDILHANAAAENFFQASAKALARMGLAAIAPPDSPLYRALEVARTSSASVNEYDLEVGTPRTGGARLVDVRVAALPDVPGALVVQFSPRSLAEKIDRQLSHASAARTVAGLAAMLAHEIKNPLSGIRGAAQLIAPQLNEGDEELARLIMDEADRIRALVEEMEALGEERPRPYAPLNIHTVLDHVKKLAEAGFAAGIPIREAYDPSLPEVLGDRDRLVQCFMNLMKNAAEAIIESDRPGVMEISTAYRPGVRVAQPGGELLALPLEVCVRNTGPAVPDDLLPLIFEPFVSGKPSGRGLGLALVAKVVRDHGGVVECDREGEWTVFRVRLPVHGG